MENKASNEAAFNENVSAQMQYESLVCLDKEKAGRLVDFLKYSGIEDTKADYDALSGTYDVQVPTADFDRARNLFKVFSQNELAGTESVVSVTASGSLYENATEKQKDYFSSAITFFVCGVAGLFILALNDLGFLKILNNSGASFILMNIVLGGLFIAFLVIGIVSFKNAKKAKEEAVTEISVSAQLTDWLSENVTAEQIEGSYNNDIPEEMKYFSRSAYIKKAVQTAFPDCSEDLAELVTDNYIEKLFQS